MSNSNTITPYRPFHCPTCTRTFRSNQTLQNHICTHTSEPAHDHTCLHCPFKSILRTMMQTHLLTHSQHPRPFLCPLCPRSFSRRTNLMTHIRTHDNSHPRRFPCPYCEHRTDRHNDLDAHIIARHQVVHTPEEQLPWEAATFPAFGWDTPHTLPSFDESFFGFDTSESIPPPDSTT